MSDQNKFNSKRSKKPPKGWVKANRVSAYQAAPPSRFRRVVGWFVNPWTVAAALFCVLGLFLTLTYYWFDFSDRIDRRLLSGEVFTPSAGIYSAPKTLRTAENMSRQGLTDKHHRRRPGSCVSPDDGPFRPRRCSCHRRHGGQQCVILLPCSRHAASS